MAAWVEERVRRRFDRVVVERTPDGVPVILGELAGSGPGRVVVYTHYDVQPVGDLSAWDSDPFGADLRDGAVVARGTCDDKADITARLQAVDYWLDANGGRRPCHDPLGLRGRRGGRQPGAPRGARPACRLALGLRLPLGELRAARRRPARSRVRLPRARLGGAPRPAARARPARRVLARAPLLRLDVDRGTCEPRRRGRRGGDRRIRRRRARARRRGSRRSRGPSCRRERPSARTASPAGRPAGRSRSSRSVSRTRRP